MPFCFSSWIKKRLIEDRTRLIRAAICFSGFMGNDYSLISNHSQEKKSEFSMVYFNPRAHFFINYVIYSSFQTILDVIYHHINVLMLAMGRLFNRYFY